MSFSKSFAIKTNHIYRDTCQFYHVNSRTRKKIAKDKEGKDYIMIMAQYILNSIITKALLLVIYAPQLSYICRAFEYHFQACCISPFYSSYFCAHSDSSTVWNPESKQILRNFKTFLHQTHYIKTPLGPNKLTAYSNPESILYFNRYLKKTYRELQQATIYSKPAEQGRGECLAQLSLQMIYSPC